MPTKTDRELLAAWRETGDESAFAELVARHRQMVYRTSLRMLGSVQDTEDAVQAVFVVLAQKADRLQREGSLGGWLHTVTRHVAMQALARRASHARREKEFAMSPEAHIETSSPDVDTSAVLRCLDQELAGLSAVLRQAVVLRYLQGNSEKAAAELAGCPLGTLSWRASKGLAKLRARLSRRGVALSGAALAGLLTSEASAAVPETLLPSILASVKTAAATGAVDNALRNGLSGSQADPILNLMLAQPKSRCAAFRLAGSIRGEKALPLLEDAFEDPDAGVRCSAVTGVAPIVGETKLALIERALSDTSVGVRREAVRALSFGGGTKAIALLGKAMLDHDPAVRKDVVFQLGMLGGEKAIVLVDQALADQDAAVRSNAAQVLGEFGLERSVMSPEKRLKDPDKTVRSQAFSSVITIGGPKAWAVLDKALHDSDLAARKSSVDELSGFFWSELREASFDRLLGKALTDPDADVRKAVVDGLGREMAKRFKGVDSAMIAQVLLKALADQDANARNAFVEGLCQSVKNARARSDYSLKIVYAELGNSSAEMLQKLAEIDAVVLKAILETLRQKFPDDPVVLQALKDAEAQAKK